MHVTFHPIGRAIAVAAIAFAALTPPAFADQPAAQLKPVPAGQAAAPGQGTARDTGKPEPAATGNTQGKSPSNPDGAGVSKPVPADGQAAGSQGTGPFDGNNGCGQEKKAGGPPDPQGGYDDNNGNCGTKPKPTAKPVAVGSTPAATAVPTPIDKPATTGSPTPAATQPAATGSPTPAATAVAIGTLLTPPVGPSTTTPRDDAPVGATVTLPGVGTLPGGAVVPLPSGTVITLLPDVGVYRLAGTQGPTTSVGIPAGSVVSAAGIGTVTLNAPLEATLGEQFQRAPASATPTSLPRTGGPAPLSILFVLAIGIATTAGGAYLRRRTRVAAVAPIN